MKTILIILVLICTSLVYVKVTTVPVRTATTASGVSVSSILEKHYARYQLASAEEQKEIENVIKKYYSEVDLMDIKATHLREFLYNIRGF